MFKFGDYLRICRETKGVTQSELVEELVAEDFMFSALDTTTLSRWERGVSKPAISKQTLITRYFSRHFDYLFPCLEDEVSNQIKENFCVPSFSKLVGRHKNMIADFPVSQMDVKKCCVLSVQETDMKMTALRKNYLVLQALFGLDFSEELHHELSEHPGNYFLICLYEGEYFGHFLALKLKPDVFNQIVNFKLKLEQLTDADFAGVDETGSYFIYGFFSIGGLPVSLMWIEFYAHLINEQKWIENVGGLVTTRQGEGIARNINTELVAQTEMNGRKFKSYQASLEQMLLTDTIVKVLFNPESCPQ